MHELPMSMRAAWWEVCKKRWLYPIHTQKYCCFFNGKGVGGAMAVSLLGLSVKGLGGVGATVTSLEGRERLCKLSLTSFSSLPSFSWGPPKHGALLGSKNRAGFQFQFWRLVDAQWAGVLTLYAAVTDSNPSSVWSPWALLSVTPKTSK